MEFYGVVSRKPLISIHTRSICIIYTHWIQLIWLVLCYFFFVFKTYLETVKAMLQPCSELTFKSRSNSSLFRDTHF